MTKHFILLAAISQFAALVHTEAKDWATFEGKDGPGKGKSIVFLTGDEEYRSEEVGVALGKILAERHGFNCTVLFAINPTNGCIEPTLLNSIPGIQALDSADLCVMALRFREWPDAQMKHFVDYVNSGKPLIGLRTTTHAFAYAKNKQSPYAKYSCRSREWPGGFGQQVLGETWVSHHGEHGAESTRGILNAQYKHHPILRGVDDIWGPSDVYTVTHLGPDARVLVWGQVLTGMQPTDPPLTNDAKKKNEPMMPLVWTREYTGENGKKSKVVTSTMGASVDLQSEGLRRLLVNACYWAVGMEGEIPAKANVDFVGEFKPLNFGFGKFRNGVKPADLELK